MELGQRQKEYESQTQMRLMRYLPMIARIDGRAFHSYTKYMKRPYDNQLCKLLKGMAKFLTNYTNADIGYTQSDEISLVWLPKEGQMFWDGRVLKIVSDLSAATALWFNSRVDPSMGEATFDARVWNVPTLDEVVNYLLWRELDATRNSVSMAAQAYYSQEELHGKSSDEMQEMLFQKGINWNEYPTHFKKGTYFIKKIVSRPFTVEDLNALPPKHAARTNPNLQITRQEVVELDIPPLIKLDHIERMLALGL